MITEILPIDTPNVIVNKFLQAQDEVLVHYKAQPYEMGALTIKITNKNAPLRIFGLDQNGHRINSNTPASTMPAIRGTSDGLMAPSLGSQDPSDCGIFYIGPGCSVEMEGLRLLHQIPSYGNGVGHGSATIANLVDNTQKSSLKITNCAIETNATTAISVRSNTARPATQTIEPVNEINVRDCRVTGNPNQGIVAGNYSSINLGYWGAVPLDLRKANFEMSGCTLDHSVFGMIVGNVLADSHSRFDVNRNRVGPTAFGVCFMARPNLAGDLAKGDINITHNIINMERYLELSENAGEPPAGAAGILVRVSSIEDGERKRITISENEIDMSHLPETSVTYNYKAAFVNEVVPPLPPGSVPRDVTWEIHNNVIVPRLVPEPVVVGGY